MFASRPLSLALALLAGCGAPPPPRATVTDLAVSVADLATATVDLAATTPDLSTAIDLTAADVAGWCGPGTCMDPAPACDPASGKCVACLPGAKDTCPAGQYCAQVNKVAACVPGCKADPECAVADPDGGVPPKRACCANQCVDVSGDSANCGKCGAACAGGRSCCGGACTDTAVDLKHCGGCGQACPAGGLVNALFSCAQSMCVITSCTLGWTDCNKVVTDGCEANVTRDPLNCGQCGRFCDVANGVGDCMAGQCVLKSCYKGFDDCNKNVGDGCETATTKDPANCGLCGNGCNAPNATPLCAAGTCSVGPCKPGFGDCDGKVQNGCEQPVSADVNHCGKCDNKCAPMNGGGTCKDGSCEIAACNAPFLDCNKQYADGCESDTRDDPLNCKTCGNKCPTPANTDASCKAGVCGAQCKAPFLDCNNDLNDGCEVDPRSNANHCDGCNKPCAQGFSCLNSMCQKTGVTYMQAFTAGQTPVAQCTAWNTFRAALTGAYTRILIKGSLAPNEATCSGAAANQLCQALRNNQATSVTCDGNSWKTGNCGNGIELMMGATSICQCGTHYSVRPCINNQNWGGVGSNNCSGPSQTITVTCE